MERVAGEIEVSLTDDTHEVVISHPASHSGIDATLKIVMMPRYARHLANVLIAYATIAEADGRGKARSEIRQERITRLRIERPDRASREKQSSVRGQTKSKSSSYVAELRS